METFLLLCILFLGVPHGASDLLLSNKLYASSNSFTFLALYVIAAGLVLISWFFFPILIFALFLFVSAWHFADTDLYSDSSLLKFSYGIWLMVSLILFHLAELLAHSTYFPGLPSVSDSVYIKYAPSFSYIIFLIGTGYFLSKSQKPKKLFLPILLLMAGFYLPFLLHFCLYFLIWHCPVAIYKMKTFSGLSWIAYFTKSFPLVFLSWILFAAIWFSSPEDEVLFRFFGLLASLTVPHSFLFNRVISGLKLQAITS